MGIKQSELADMIMLTLNDLPKQEFEVAWDNQDYEFCRIYNNEAIKVGGGNEIERMVMLDNLGNAHYRRAYDTDNPKIGQVMHNIKVNWTRLGTDYSWDEFEVMQNQDDAKGFIDLLKTKRIEGLWSLAELIEERGWKTPTDANDDLYPYGVPYYLRLMNTGTTTDGFVGQTISYQDGTTGTTCANIDASTEAKWRNWAALYTEIDNAMMTTFRKAFWSTNFKAPLFINDPGSKRNMQKRIYCDIDVACKLADFADAKQDNHSGKDVLGKMVVNEGTMVYVNSVPVVPIAQLADYTDPSTSTAVAPIFCVDFSHLKPMVKSGYWMKETEPMVDRGQHTTFTVFLDGAHQNLCTNVRRLGFVLHKSH